MVPGQTQTEPKKLVESPYWPKILVKLILVDRNRVGLSLIDSLIFHDRKLVANLNQMSWIGNSHQPQGEP